MTEQIVPQHFPMSAGDEKTIKIDVFDRSDQPVDLTGGTCRIAFARTNTSPAEFQNAGSIEQGADINGNDISTLNRLSLVVAPADTANLRGTYYWEAEFLSAGGTPSTVAFGSVLIGPTVLN